MVENNQRLTNYKFPSFFKIPVSKIKNINKFQV